MTAFRAKSGSLARGWRPLALAVAMACLPLAPAMAQGTQVETQPGTLGAPASQPGRGAVESTPLALPTQLLPLDRSIRQPTGPAATDQTPRIEGIEIDRLSKVDTEAIGILDDGQDGLGRDLWRGSDRSFIEELLPQLPAHFASITLRDLARRLLLSRAAPPARSGSAEGTAATLLALRIDRLSAMGEIEGLTQLLSLVPQRYQEEPISRARVEVRLLRGDLKGGCQEVRNGIALHFALAYWQRSLVLCQLVSGQQAQAELGLGLLREQGAIEGPGFYALVDALSGIEAKVPAAIAAQPLAFAALQAVGLPPPEGFLEEAGPGIWFALATSSKASLDMRAAAAELAVAEGALAPTVLDEIYRSYRFSPKQLGGRDLPRDFQRDAAAGPKGRALLYQRQIQQTQPLERAQAVQALLEAAQDAGLAPAALQLVLSAFAWIPIEPQFLWFAETAGRALYAAGSYERAGAWFFLARRLAGLNPEAAAFAARLWPYMRLAGGSSLSSGGSLTIWRASRRDAGAEALARWEALLRASQQALGVGGSVTLAELAAEQAVPGQTTPESGLLLALTEASEAGRSGETVLLALVMLAGEPLGAIDPLTLNGTVSALRRVGLELESRALAIEAVVASGI